jgi:hypothetical protein
MKLWSNVNLPKWGSFQENFDATGEGDRLMHGPNIILDHTNIYPKFHPICAGNRADYYV